MPNDIPYCAGAEAHIAIGGLRERHVEELRAHARKLQKMVADKRPSYLVPGDGWVCFHCGLRFNTPESASAHFGDGPTEKPVCHADRASPPADKMVQPVAWEHRFRARAETHFADVEWGPWQSGPAPELSTLSTYEVEDRPLYATPPSGKSGVGTPEDISWIGSLIKAEAERRGVSAHVRDTVADEIANIISDEWQKRSLSASPSGEETAAACSTCDGDGFLITDQMEANETGHYIEIACPDCAPTPPADSLKAEIERLRSLVRWAARGFEVLASRHQGGKSDVGSLASEHARKLRLDPTLTKGTDHAG